MNKKPFLGHQIKPIDTTAIVSRIGGLPRGFEYQRWPVCKTCQRRQVFLLQLDLWAPVRLARRHRWAFVFACDDPVNCEPFLEDTGANAVILVTDKAAEASMESMVEENNDAWPTVPECHVAFQPWTEDESEWLGTPELFLGITPSYQFEEVPPCPHCDGEMSLAVQLEYDGSPCIIMICNRECQDNSAYFMW